MKKYSEGELMEFDSVETQKKEICNCILLVGNFCWVALLSSSSSSPGSHF